ncbi:phasin family protein [Rhodovarius crocodyli]|uniref:Phasin family protein n=1 Tax=Rhodovarius crocodyli TaxID=1979269 RepID=A0A437MNF8_9PROT|nr:TIGR01841 family phasin [Rhodovarius crocodyli]RVT99184.1 phasin family protein [Rhodovarius crocodyli]
MKLFGEFRMPAMPDFQALAEAQRKNIEAITAANKIAIEGAQAVARRQVEILQSSVSELSSAVQNMSREESPVGKVARQTDLIKSSYEKAVSNVKELSDLIQKSNNEALNLLNARFSAAMDEVKSAVSKG